ncbi:hypothetical protein QTO01_16240 [Vibrio mytili]
MKPRVFLSLVLLPDSRILVTFIVPSGIDDVQEKHASYFDCDVIRASG